MVRVKFADLYMALRFEYLAFTLLLPILGAVSAASSITWVQATGLLALAFSFHTHAALINDLMDLPLDRTNPERAQYPLARGSLKPRYALSFALLTFPLAIVVAVLQEASSPAYVALIAAFVLMAIYNLWGKCSVALLMDVVLGAAFGALALYGAAIAGRLGSLTFVVFVLVILWILLANTFGGLRDLVNDIRHNAATTPIAFGVRPAKNGLHIPRSLMGYMNLVIALFYAFTVLALIYGLFGYEPFMRDILLIVVIVSAVVTIVVLASLYRAAPKNGEVMMMHANFILAVTSGITILVFAPRVSVWLAICIALLFLYSFTHWQPARLFRFWREQLR